jgi:hypothetical protein
MRASLICRDDSSQTYNYCLMAAVSLTFICMLTCFYYLLNAMFLDILVRILYYLCKLEYNCKDRRNTEIALNNNNNKY